MQGGGVFYTTRTNKKGTILITEEEQMEGKKKLFVKCFGDFYVKAEKQLV